MTKEEHTKVFSEFSMKEMGKVPSQKFLDKQWDFAVLTGACKGCPIKYKEHLYQEWEAWGRQLYYQQRASKN